ncbi:hypothetical protein [Sphingomonas hankyongi]|uniref:Secreted protein n=1 Tax=Sphingomonas hankyongi TaxID=2908209 RepID=A0ABT0S236_9SPHN|nr:hypothetical protein [Sphingomonas hankyongi]MCL6729907.1 hypothetical protein [Sphingomonas hankyongi]
MSKLTMMLSAAATAVAGIAALPAPATAQTQTVGEIVVYGTDPCPRATDDTVVICRRLPEAMRYRLPEQYRPGATFQEKQSWTNKARTAATLGNTGIGSCTAVGPGGTSGCLVQEIEQNKQTRKQEQQATTAPEQ